MFTGKHFIWLGISAAIIAIHIILNKKFKFSYKANLYALFVVALVSEVVKIMLNMETLVGPTFETSGTYLNYESLPFHLCSIQLFFIVALMFFIKNDSTRDTILGFMVPSMGVGALMSLLIPTEGVLFTEPQVYQYFIYHAYIIAFAIYLLTSKTVIITYKVMFKNICILSGFGFISLYINGILSSGRTNFMFVTRPPMENLPILNLNQGWHMYFLKLMITAVILMVVFHLPFAIHNSKKSKAE